MIPIRAALVSFSLICCATASAWPVVSYVTEVYQTPYFNVTRSNVEPTADGYLFLGFNLGGADVKGPVIVQDDGTLVWQGPLLNADTGAYNVHVQELNDQPVLSYWEGVHFAVPSGPGHGYGSVTILDQTYTPLYQNICLPPEVNSDINPPIDYPPGQCFIDGHESYIDPDRNSLIVTVYNATQTDLTALGGPTNGWVFDGLFYEIDIATNEVLFSWSALEHVDLTTSNYINTTGPNKLLFQNQFAGNNRSTPWDFFHINSVQPIPGGYIVDSRMTWSFYIVNSTTGNVDYTIEGSNGGDFALEDDIFFSWQHNPRLNSVADDGTMYISLFNNDNIPLLEAPINGSSGYSLAVNFTDMTVSADRYLQDQTRAPVISVAEGGYQALPNGHALLGYGETALIQEYGTSNSSPIYTAQFAALTIDSATTHSYRAYRQLWVGTPVSVPKVVATTSGASSTNVIVNVAMSWNGATEYVSWNILVGTKKSARRLAASGVARTGFETKHVLQLKKSQTPQYLKVQALDSAGNILSTSHTVNITHASS